MKDYGSVLALFNEALSIWNVRQISERTGISLDRLNRYKKFQNELDLETQITLAEYKTLKGLVPIYVEKPTSFDFIDLFAGIGGIRKGFESAGGRCVFTSEWDEYALRTYKANFPNCPEHRLVKNIKDITQPKGKSKRKVPYHIRKHIPAHDLLLAGFPCQPFSIAGVSKKNALGRVHGFECEDQGQLFFDIIRILKARKPSVIVLENVKNLKSHDKGNTFRVIKRELVKTGYWIANLDDERPDPKVIDGQNFLPQHRERVILVGFRKDLASQLDLNKRFSLENIQSMYPATKPTLVDILDENPKVPPKYTLTPKLWKYLFDYAAKHKAKGNGFGYGIVHRNETDIARTLSARYYKDGSEILIGQPDTINDPIRAGRPRRLTPQECARLMGFSIRGESEFEVPVSDTQAYKQFGNSVIVPVFEAIAKMVVPLIKEIRAIRTSKKAA